MDNTDPSKSAVGPPFIAAANALANLYKKAAAVEKESRDLGARSAYMRVMQWAAVKSRNNEKITAAELMNLCSSELAKIPVPSSRNEEETTPFSSSGTRAEHYETRQRTAAMQHQNQSQNVGGGDALASDIRKLAVNPRKRQRISISETFIRACEDSGNGSLFSMGTTREISPRSSERDRSIAMIGNSPLEDVDIREGRAGGSVNRGTSVRKFRSVRDSVIEKQRRK